MLTTERVFAYFLTLNSRANKFSHASWVFFLASISLFSYVV